MITHRLFPACLSVLTLALVGCVDKPVPAVDDTGSDADTDADSDTDTDADSDADTDTDTDTDSDTDTGVNPLNLLANPGFEDGWTDWLIYPSGLTNFAVVNTGDTLYNSTDTFTADQGGSSLKLYGQYTGGANETPFYQQFAAIGGQVYTFSGNAWMHNADPIAAADTTAYLSIKYFNDSYQYLGSSDSSVITNTSAVDVWAALSVTGTVPEGATKAQASIEYWQCVGDTSGACYNGGSVYFDDMLFTLDSSPDTGDTADTGDTGDTSDTGTASMLSNGGFEEGGLGTWSIYPSGLTNYGISATGEGIYGSSTGATFAAAEGTYGLKVYGQFTGTQSETPIFQSFAATGGETHTFSGKAFMAAEDAITGTTYATIALKYFDSSYNYYGTDEAAHIDSASAVDAWTDLTVTGTVPAGATIMQASIEYWHCFGDTSFSCYTGGSVYFDDLVLE